MRSDAGGLLAAFLIMAGLYFARQVLIPLTLAGLITFLLAPVASRLERWRLPRTLSGLLVIGLTIFGIGSIGWVVLDQVYNLALELPQYQQNITAKVDGLHLHSAGQLTTTVQMLSEVSRQITNGTAEVRTISPAPEPTRRRGKGDVSRLPQKYLTPTADGPVSVRIEPPRTPLATLAIVEIEPLIGPITSAFAVIIFVVFMLLARHDIRDRTVRLMGSKRIHTTTVAMTDAATRVSRYLLMQFVVNLAYGAVVGLGLWAIGVPHPLLWAVTSFLLRFVPYIGIVAAGAGPILIALAASPNWSTAGWTLGLYVFLELVTANAVEPKLYGSSTGVSALAILVAAVFWTWLWGIPGLLLSTPLTVCLIVVGQHAPRLGFLGVLFGEQTVLEPPERLYQRILATDSADARRLFEEEIKLTSRELVYDRVIIPTLCLVENARHTEQLNYEQTEKALQQIEKLVDEQWPGAEEKSETGGESIICVAVKDLADDVACHLLMQVLSASHSVETLASDLMSADVVETIARVKPKVICVVGVPPQAIRHVRARCHQLRNRFPEITFVACVFSIECDLADVRSRIPIEDAHHVVCSLQQAQEYLSSLALSPAAIADSVHAAPPPPSQNVSMDLPLDESCDDIFQQIANRVARSFEAPIALINIHGQGKDTWQAQCGLPDQEKITASSLRDSSICRQVYLGHSLIIADTTQDDRFSKDPILLEKGIRFFAGVPILGLSDEPIGSLCVFDTRPRQVTQHQENSLKDLAESVTKAIALR